MSLRILALCVVSTLLLPALASAATPTTVTVEGALNSSGGGPVADGVYNLTFAIYDKVKDGTAAWTEGPVPVATKAGRFAYHLGGLKALDAGKLAALPKQWLGIKVGIDPELPRQQLRAVAFALHAGMADKLKCSGCLQATHIANGAISGAKVGFAYAASATKGGPALKAKDLDCTGCVAVGEMAFDKDVDLKGKTFTAGKLTSSGDISAAGVVAAKQFVGDGSKLTGIKTPAGTCSKAGEVVKGIDASGKLICIKALDPKNLPADGLDKISGDSLGNRFDDVLSGGTGKDIPDFNNNGLLDVIDVPKIGKAEAFEVYVEVSKAPMVDVKPKDGKPDYDPTDLTIFLFPPSTKALPAQRGIMINDFLKKPAIDGTIYPHYVLHQGTGAGTLAVIGTWPTKNKEVKGDLHKDWLGKDPAGKWRLMIVDNGDRLQPDGKTDAKTDGKLVKWTIKMRTLSGNQVIVNGDLFVGGKVWGKYKGHDHAQLGDVLEVGGDLKVHGKIVGGLGTDQGYIDFGGVKTWYGMFPDGSRPFVYGYYEDKMNTNLMAGYRYDRAYQVPIDVRTMHRATQQIMWGDDRGNIHIQKGGDNYANGSSDQSQMVMVAFIKNTTASTIKHTAYFYGTSRGTNSNHGGISINGSNVWTHGGNWRGTNSVTLSFPANKTSVVVLKMGQYQYDGWYGMWNRIQIGWYNDTWSATKMPKGLAWDYKMYWQWARGG